MRCETPDLGSLLDDTAEPSPVPVPAAYAAAPEEVTSPPSTQYADDLYEAVRSVEAMMHQAGVPRATIFKYTSWLESRTAAEVFVHLGMVQGVLCSVCDTACTACLIALVNSFV